MSKTSRKINSSCYLFLIFLFFVKSTNLVVFTVKVETYQRNENFETKQGNQTGINSESLETCLLHKLLQVTPIDGGVKDLSIEVLQQE